MLDAVYGMIRERQIFTGYGVREFHLQIQEVKLGDYD
jgi:hypothetical protein